jgi:hypothetical protein
MAWNRCSWEAIAIIKRNTCMEVQKYKFVVRAVNWLRICYIAQGSREPFLCKDILCIQRPQYSLACH